MLLLAGAMLLTWEFGVPVVRTALRLASRALVAFEFDARGVWAALLPGEGNVRGTPAVLLLTGPTLLTCEFNPSVQVRRTEKAASLD